MLVEDGSRSRRMRWSGSTNIVFHTRRVTPRKRLFDTDQCFRRPAKPRRSQPTAPDSPSVSLESGPDRRAEGRKAGRRLTRRHALRWLENFRAARGKLGLHPARHTSRLCFLARSGVRVPGAHGAIEEAHSEVSSSAQCATFRNSVAHFVTPRAKLSHEEPEAGNLHIRDCD